MGCFYLAVYQLGSGFVVPDDYLMSDEFDNRNLLVKLLLVGIWGRLTLYKYISMWIISEGAATCFGKMET